MGRSDANHHQSHLPISAEFQGDFRGVKRVMKVKFWLELVERRILHVL